MTFVCISCHKCIYRRYVVKSCSTAWELDVKSRSRLLDQTSIANINQNVCAIITLHVHFLVLEKTEGLFILQRNLLV